MPILSFLTSIYILMMEVNPQCDRVTFHPSSPVTVSTFRSVQSICRQIGSDGRGGGMDRDADSHGEEEQGRNKKGEPRRLLSDKKVHATERRGERNGGGVLTHLHWLCIYIFLTPHHLRWCCGPWATWGPVVKLFTRLTSSFPFEGAACGPAPLMPDTDFPPAAHPCPSRQLSPPLATTISATAGRGAE